MAVAFDRQLVAFGLKVDELARRATVKLVKRVHREIQLRTPIRTGRAVGSWNASVGGANTRTLPPEFSVGDGELGAKREAAAPFGEVSVDDMQLGDTAHVSNALSYIFDLNAGTSRQAPRNFVEMAVQVAAGDAGPLF